MLKLLPWDRALCSSVASSASTKTSCNSLLLISSIADAIKCLNSQEVTAFARHFPLIVLASDLCSNVVSCLLMFLVGLLILCWLVGWASCDLHCVSSSAAPALFHCTYFIIHMIKQLYSCFGMPSEWSEAFKGKQAEDTY